MNSANAYKYINSELKVLASQKIKKRFIKKSEKSFVKIKRQNINLVYQEIIKMKINIIYLKKI